MKILIAILLIVHGLITTAQASGSFRPSGGLANPAFLSWWPVGLGQSWLWAGLRMENSLLARAGGLVWLAAGALLVAAGLSLLEVVIPAGLWRTLALAGAGLSLLMLALYLHPFYAVGITASGLLLAALLARAWPVLERLGI
ncbi:MAG TPA: hypothetical protein VIO36_05200 [Anaerolineaceae bacterium]